MRLLKPSQSGSRSKCSVLRTVLAWSSPPPAPPPSTASSARPRSPVTLLRLVSPDGRRGFMVRPSTRWPTFLVDIVILPPVGDAVLARGQVIHTRPHGPVLDGDGRHDVHHLPGITVRTHVREPPGRLAV